MIHSNWVAQSLHSRILLTPACFCHGRRYSLCRGRAFACGSWRRCEKAKGRIIPCGWAEQPGQRLSSRKNRKETEERRNRRAPTCVESIASHSFFTYLHLHSQRVSSNRDSSETPRKIFFIINQHFFTTWHFQDSRSCVILSLRNLRFFS